MKTPRDLRQWAQSKYRAGHRRWLTSPFESLTFTTGVPIERDVSADPDAVAAWVTSWRAFDRSTRLGVTVEWVDRRWQSFGAQQLPVRVRVGSTAAVAELAVRSQHWQTLRDRADQVLAAWPDAEELPAAIPRLAGRLEQLTADDVPRLIALANWLHAHPDSGLLPRQLPVEGSTRSGWSVTPTWSGG